jgi:uncharacterized Ntn-hydrolase superfamily protein
MKPLLLFFHFALFVFHFSLIRAQDTFSIVALDSVTGEVGSAGASCVDLFGFPGYADDFLGDLIPGVGAINTQAYYLGGNQSNARARMNQGDTPQEIIDWLVANDVQNNPTIRQYGIVGFVNGSPQSAAHTGANTNDYKGHVLGPTYSIQGNILLGQEVLDSMEARFNNASGDLACKLMAALQGANMVGADTRCATNNSSSLFAFVKVSQPNDPYGSPSFLVSVRTQNGDSIEPIDTLQTLFDAVKNCSTTGINTQPRMNELRIYPQPAQDQIKIEISGMENTEVEYQVVDALGRAILRTRSTAQTTLDLRNWAPGVYTLRAKIGDQVLSKSFLKN